VSIADACHVQQCGGGIGVRAVGTMAHWFIEAFPDEAEAFRNLRVQHDWTRDTAGLSAGPAQA
jgi:nicotinic acid phosphoribosyltransferase